jgi:hypothetical protein
VRFELTQELPGSIGAVFGALLDPSFVASLGALPNMAPPEVIDQRAEGDRVVQRTRYRFTGSLSSAVTRVIDPHKLTWVDETTYDVAAKRATFRILPDHYADKLRCAGTYEFTDRGAATVRRIDGDLAVRFPLLGKLVERAIVSGLEDHLRAEAQQLEVWLDMPGGGRDD